jgi:hypothetical protein
MGEGRVLSRQSPATPSSPNRSCQRQITVLALPVARVISAVRKIATPRGGRWHAQTVKLMIERLAA